MDRFVIIGDHMVDIGNVKTARIDRSSYQLLTLDPLGEVNNTYSFKNLVNLIEGLTLFTYHMNEKDKLEQINKHLATI